MRLLVPNKANSRIVTPKSIYAIFGGSGSSGGVEAPVAAGALVAQRFAHNTGTKTYDVSGDFTGENLVFSLDGSPPTGVSIDSNTGVVSVNTAPATMTLGFYRTSITVRATNDGGFDTSSFNLTVCSVHLVQVQVNATTAQSFDLSAYPSTNRRIFLLSSAQADRTLTIDGAAASALVNHNHSTTNRRTKVFTSTTSESTVDLTWNLAPSGGTHAMFVTYGYDATLTDTADAEDAGSDADASVLTDINVPALGAIMLLARDWETITTPATGLQQSFVDQAWVVGCRTLEAEDTTFDLQVDTDAADANKTMLAISVAPLAA